jgi:hypothetical protein
MSNLAMMNLAMNKKVLDRPEPATTAHGLLLALLGVLIFSLLSACATSGSKSGEEKIENRAQARWDALLAGDIETAYGYLSPGYRSSVSLIDYGVDLRVRRVHWTSATYKEHSCENKICDVKFIVGYRIVGEPVSCVSRHICLYAWNAYFATHLVALTRYLS